MTNTRKSLVGIVIAAAIALATLVSVSTQDKARTTPSAHEAVQAVSEISASTNLTPPVSAEASEPQRVIDKPQMKPQMKLVAVESIPSTTTSEVPPRLTAEQEENIPDSDEETFQRGDAFDAHDYDLPSETIITVPTPRN